ncbi:hypothetical protein DUNSADRAFT_4317 [Dunaliella salina]|uniref:Uncharacterized protein n=1 Tax=Dunaliella salina TaxID=3046 RepID=A0ABQ7H7N0_DUNSA|nr:hypothetical protein DUNSADRAFT_4317 [Dunaliella salina]|eukprot:KAF5842858.1 hypothetical protein DUNSADRAFT_4317 [Dunaliella salina]
MRLETLLAIYDALLSDERVSLDSLGFLEELFSTQQGGDGTVIIYARRLCRQAEDALKQDDLSTMLASLLSLRFYLCNAEHEQFWRLHLGEDGRKALWSGQSAGGLHQLPGTPEDVLETIFCTAVTYQLTQDLGLENPDQLVHALEHHRYASVRKGYVAVSTYEGSRAETQTWN